MRDLGVLINEPHTVVGKIESGERRLDVYEYVQYCEALEISPKDGIDVLCGKDYECNSLKST
ncbi:MAG: hypothetical protein OQL19_17745 [Gammaproteobacteria bacterium]|nr:hypothetical protein [Gammaproteobacteria bacterium]